MRPAHLSHFTAVAVTNPRTAHTDVNLEEFPLASLIVLWDPFQHVDDSGCVLPWMSRLNSPHLRTH